MKYYNIEVLKDHIIFVTVLSTEMTSVYWPILTRDLARLGIKNCDVYFDFMVRNGLNDRFYSTHLDEDVTVMGSLKKCKISVAMKYQADSFFINHKRYISRSVLTEAQRTFYLKKLVVKGFISNHR